MNPAENEALPPHRDTGRMRALGLGLSLVWRSRPVVVVCILAAALAEAVVLYVGLTLGSGALRDALSGGGLARVAVVVLAVALLLEALSAVGNAAGTLLRQEIGAEISVRGLAALRGVPFEQIEDNGWQGEVGLALREAAYRPGFLIDNFVGVVQSSAALLGVFAGAIGVLGPGILLVPVVVLPLLAIEGRLRSRLIAVQTASAPELMRMQFLAQMSVDADWQRDIRASRSDVVEREYGRLAKTYLRRLRGAVVVTTVWRTVAGAVVIAIVVVAALLLVARSDALASDPGRLAILLGVLALSGGYLRSLVATSGELFTSAEYLALLFSVLGPLTPLADAPSGGTPTQVAEVLEEKGASGSALAHIRLQGVSYGYPSRDNLALDAVCLDLTPGLIAVTGPNGAGKTTLVKLLCGLLQPRTGTIAAIDDQGRTIPWPDLDRTVMFQNAAHLRLSVRQNVTLGRAGVDDARVWTALRAAGLERVVQGLPRGLDTVLGPGFGGDSDLSGGQWQRVALARVLYAESPLVICDEPATGLDAVGEAQLMKHLTRLAEDRIVIIVTHRAETIDRCTRAITLIDGEVITDVLRSAAKNRARGAGDAADGSRTGERPPWLSTLPAPGAVGGARDGDR